MAIRRRETKDGVRYDVQWRLPDRSKRKKTFRTEREARQFEAKLVTDGALRACGWIRAEAKSSSTLSINPGSLHAPT